MLYLLEFSNVNDLEKMFFILLFMCFITLELKKAINTNSDENIPDLERVQRIVFDVDNVETKKIKIPLDWDLTKTAASIITLERNGVVLGHPVTLEYEY